jgi:hypothetical protein
MYGTVRRNEVAGLLAKGAVSGTNLKATENAPGSQTASTVVLGQKDSSVGAKATLDIETEETVVVVGTFTPSHKLAIYINGVEYHIQLDAV